MRNLVVLIALIASIFLLAILHDGGIEGASGTIRGAQTVIHGEDVNLTLPPHAGVPERDEP